MRLRYVLPALLCVACAASAAPSGRDAVLALLAQQAKQRDASLTAFSPERGKAFWTTPHSGGNPETKSCTACHTQDPHAIGQTRAGKRIEPMAVSKNPTRFTDPKKVAQWFGRNCKTVLGRACTPTEEGDVIAYLATQ